MSTPEEPTFADLNLDPRICAAVDKLGFTTPTPIQIKAVPVILEGRDVIGGARTGSGKTAAFGLPIIHRLIHTESAGKGARALILAPTRELAQQVADAITDFCKGIPEIGVVAVYGGAPYGPQMRALSRGVPIVVGTPGRLIDHLERGTIDLSNVQTVVLDEADEMLRMGFLDAVEKLLDATPDTRQVALFSASLPSRIQQMASRYLKDPADIQVESAALSVDHIKQSWMMVPYRNKLDALVRILRGEQREAMLVFVRTRKACAEVADELANRGVPVDSLHGDMPQAARDRVIDRLRAKRLDVLICTDVAARGIDIAHVSHVVNFDMPDEVGSYVHRIGRTGRAGREGRAISFVTPRERRRIHRFQQVLKIQIPKETVATDAQIAERTRNTLWTDIMLRKEDATLDNIKAWITEALEKDETELTLEELAATAIAMLAHDRGPIFEVLDDTLPGWATASDRHQRNDRNDRSSRSDGADRGPRTERPHRGPAGDWVDIILPIGRRRGVRPGDVMGALTHGAGLTGDQVGRITILDFQTFVGIPAQVIDPLLDSVHTVSVRGVDVPLRRARPRTQQ